MMYLLWIVDVFIKKNYFVNIYLREKKLIKKGENNLFYN